MKKNKTIENSENNKILEFNDHKAPVTRRDFLAMGAISMSTIAFTSGTASLLSSSNVFGQATGCNGENYLCGNVPYLCLDGAGGMNIAGGNALVGFERNQYQEDFGSNILSDYRRLGIPDSGHPSKTGMVDPSYGLKFHSTSGIKEGMDEALSPRIGESIDLREHVDGLILTGITGDDSSMNPLNTTYMAQKAGAMGELVQIIGSNNTVTGGNSTAPSDQINLTLKPSFLNNFASSEGLLSIGDNLSGDRLLGANAEGPKSFMALIRRLGQQRLNQIKRNPALANQIVSYQERQGRALGVFDQFSASELNALKNPSDQAILTAAYNVPMLTNLSGDEQRACNIINLLTKRTAGAATITVGGCDYHNGTATTGHMRDKQIGRHIGFAIRIAAARGVPLFIHLFTDGGVSGDTTGQVDPAMPNRVIWAGDSGERSCALMIVFNPNKKRVNTGTKGEHSNFLINNATRQIGHFKAAGGVVIDGHSLANNSAHLWRAVMLNYLATLVNSNDDNKVIYEVGEAFKKKFGSLPTDWQSLVRLKSLIA